MTAIFLSPHNDDETLFGSVAIQRNRPTVIVCFRATKGMAGTREAETVEALEHLLPAGFEWAQWHEFSDDRPAPQAALERRVRECLEGASQVFAPAVEPVGGNPQHDQLGTAAREVAGELGIQLTTYTTYTNGRGRSGFDRADHAKAEMSGDEIRRKLLALAEYRSQHGLWATAHHFLADQNEWYR